MGYHVAFVFIVLTRFCYGVSNGCRGSLDGDVRGMDAEVKPPWTGLRRPRSSYPGRRSGLLAP